MLACEASEKISRLKRGKAVKSRVWYTVENELLKLNVALWCCERCLDRKQWFPPEEPQSCNRKRGIYRSSICCDKEYCNKNITLELLSPNSPELSSGILQSSLFCKQQNIPYHLRVFRFTFLLFFFPFVLIFRAFLFHLWYFFFFFFFFRLVGNKRWMVKFKIQ